jgi:hypothetical protein
MLGPDPLNSSVKLYFPEGNLNNQLALSRISFSAGTVAAASSGLPYTEHARIPASRWRSPSPTELEKLVTPRPLQRGNCVVLSRLFEDRELAQVQAEMIAVRTRFGDLGELKKELLEITLNSLKSKCRKYEVTNVLGLNTDPGNLETTSINRSTGLFAGLHVDVWEDRSLEERHLCANRISINLGPSHRYFLFACISVAEMKSALPEGSIGSDLESLAYVQKSFLEKYPEFPIARLRIEAGEAYFAPTENLIHDGSTSDCSTPPFTFALQGVFEF